MREKFRKLIVCFIALSLVFTSVPFEVYGVEYQDTNLVIESGEIEYDDNTLYPADGVITSVDSASDCFYIKIDSSLINENLKITFDRMTSNDASTSYVGAVSASHVIAGSYDLAAFNDLILPQDVGADSGYYRNGTNLNYVAEFLAADINVIKSVNGPVYLLFGTNTDNATYSNVQAFTNVGAETTYTISGSAGIAGATLSYNDGTAKTATADSSGNYSFTVTDGWSGTVTPSKAGYIFTPASKSYINVAANQTSQDYSATAAYAYDFESNTSGSGSSTVTQTINGETISCAATGDTWQILEEIDSIGDVPTHSGKTLATNSSEEYSGATSIRISNADNKFFTFKTLCLVDNYYLLHSGSNITITSSKGGTPIELELTDFTTDSDWGYMIVDLSSNSDFKDVSYVDFTVTSGKMWVTLDNIVLSDIKAGYTIAGNAGVAGATLSYTDGTAKTATADSSGNYSFTVSEGWTGTVTPSKADYTFAPASMDYTNVTSNQTTQNYSATAEVWNEITNRTELENINNNLSANYRLMADIDLAGEDWIPMGSSASPFTGKFDGNSKIIRNLTITDTTKTDQGLFSVVGSSGVISKLGIEGANITAANNTGILAGTNAGTLSQCYTKGSASGFSYVGGLVGQNSGVIQNSYTQASVNGKDYFGGLAGSSSGTVQTSYASSPLSASVFNNYLSFNGTPVGDYSSPNSGGYIDIAHKDFYVQNQFTLEAWFQWDKVGTNDCNFIIGKGYEQFEIHTGGGSGVNGIRFIPIWNNAGDSHIDVKNAIQPGWFHVAAVYDYSAGLQQATCRVLINGVAQDLWRGTANLGKTAIISRAANTLGYGMVNSSLVPQQNNINIGRRTDGWFYFDGKISDVRFWNIARTETEIKRDKDKVLTGTETGLVGYWKLNEASGNAMDSTPNNNNGTLIGDVVRTSEAAAVHKGGLIGCNSGTVNNSFYDSEVANLTDDTAGIHKSTAEMKNRDTFTGAGWNFTDLWDINSEYPYFKNQTFSVYFESNGGSTVNPIYRKSYLETITAPGAPAKNDYIFGGWYKESSLINLWDFAADTMPAKDITLYARWVGNQYTVTYDAEGGSVTPGSQIKMVGATYGNGNDGVTDDFMPTPTREGYTFDGWFSGDNGTGNYITNSTVVTTTANHTLYARWTLQQFTLTFDAEGGSAVTAVTQNYNTQVAAPTAPAKEGYTFAGWYEGDNGTGSEVSFPYTLTGDKTVYAKWVSNPYTVTFKNYDNTILKEETVLYGDSATSPTNPERAGYTFTGWSSAFTSITGNLTVTAQYTANTNTPYKVEHYQQKVDGTGYTLADTDNLTGTTDQTATAGVKTYTGFNENTSHVGRVPSGTITANGSQVLKLYYDRNHYTVTFKDYNDTELKTESVLYEGSATAPADPTRAGYTFTGWSAAFAGITGDLTVTAQYTANTNTAYKVEHYKQNVDGAGYTVAETENLTGTTDQTATAGVKTYTGFNENTSHVGRVPSGTITSNGSQVLKLYYDRNHYTVTFKDYNDTELKTESVLYEGSAIAPADPIRAGYTFTGWSEVFTNITGDLTITAQYTANTNTAYKVEHYQQTVDGTGYTVAETENLTGTTDASATAFAKSYTGFTENTGYVSRIATGMIAGDGSLVLKLYYDRIPYTVTFKDYNDTTLKTETVLYEGSATAPADPTRTGYTFTGWSAAFTSITGNLTVTAQYTANVGIAYKVEHYQQDVTGTVYTLIDTDNLTGTTDEIATASAKSYIGFNENTGHTDRIATGTITGNESLVLKLYYDRVPYTVTFNNWNGTEIETQIVLYGGSATAPADPTRAGYTFTSWSTGYTDITGNLTVTAQYTANVGIAYKVGHYQQDVTGTVYTLIDTDDLTGTTDQTATAMAKSYTGFNENTIHEDRVPSGTIAGNGSLILKLYYDRVPYTVTFNNWNGTEIETQTVLYGGSATAPADPTRTGYTFAGWSSGYTDITGDLTITAQYTANTDTAYKVEHYKQTADGMDYTLADTDNLTGTTGESVTAVAESYTGFKENSSYPGRVVTGIVAADGSLVLKLYYDRTYTIAPITTQSFVALTAGYTTGTQETKTITVTKTGTGNLANLSAGISGGMSSSFEIIQPDITTLDAGAPGTTFKVKAKDGLTEGTYTETVTVSADRMTDVTFTITQIVTELAAPTIQSAVSGDEHVAISWSSVPEATGYKIYASTVSGLYTTSAAIVAGSENSYDVTELINGTTYYFVVKAVNGEANSANSNEANATPQVTAPGAPVLQSATTGDGYVRINWNAVEGSTGYMVYSRTLSGSYTTPAAIVAGSVNSCNVTELINGTTYYFVVKAVNPGGESAYSNEVGAMPQIPAPGVPAEITATEGNAKVTLNWNSVNGANGYKIYQTTTSGSYGTELTTVSGTVYSYEAAGLTNGVTYYYKVRAVNAGGDSNDSVEVSATPKTVPGTPANVTAVAGNGWATVTFTSPSENGGSPITGYIVTSNPGNITATGTDTTITVTGLTNGTTYTFNVQAVNEAGNGQESTASNEVIPSRPSNEDTSDSKESSEGIEILVNGKTETAATATTAIVEDKKVTTVTVDDKKVEEKLKEERNNSVVTIPVKNDSDIVVGVLNGQTVKNMEAKQAILEVKTENVTYTLPASQINIDAVSEQIGQQVDLKDISVNVKISDPEKDTAKIVEDTANKNNYQIVVKPVDFEITCTSGNKTVEVSKFNAYVERMVAIPEGLDPSRITTGIVLNPDGTFSHVPTTIVVIDGKYYAKINSLTNSTYSVIWSPKTFNDVENHWAKEAVNDMGSRLVIDGVGDRSFEPDRDITRAEFAVIVIKALGLMRPGTGKDTFNDVTKDSFYYDAVSIAYDYQIISGYGNGKFGPMDKITREEAMTMVAKAMKITGLNVEFKSDEVESLLEGFGDSAISADWAKESMSACIKTGIVSGKSGKTLAPKDKITRAEVAVIVRKLLQESGLI